MGASGRPTDYNDEIATEICDRIASSSNGLRKLCSENSHWPDHATIYKWIFRHPAFGDKYAQAKARQVEILVDEILEIADNTSRDKIIKIDKNGNKREVCDNEYVNRSRLRIDTRKWIACKLAPKIYGDRAEKSSDDTAKSIMQQLIDKI
jgi:hypothetical protein